MYLHVEPGSDVIRYVGKGTAGRAWSCGSSTAKPGLRGNRTAEHNAWINTLLGAGHTPADFVRIYEKGLSNVAAKQLERRLLDEYRQSHPLFNRQLGLKILRITEESLEIARSMFKAGKSWDEVIATVGVSRMTIWRALNNKTKATKAWT